MIDVKTCPLCQSSDWQSVLSVTDNSISHELFSLKKCASCSFLVTSPRPSEVDLLKYYQSDDYISHSRKSQGLINSIYLTVRNYSLRWKLRLVNDLQLRGAVLDIGCGTGEFLNTLKKAGWKVTGIEPGTSPRQKAQELIREPVLESIGELRGTFNLISMWHVLEHLPDLDSSLRKIYESLHPNGTLLIAVPNHESHDARKYGKYWAGYDVPRHLWHFRQQTMVLLLQKYGFTLIKTIPMKLDAFYVSMLSEKYQQNRSSLIHFFHGVLNGLASNLAARKTGEYSSLIYIAKK